MMLFVKISCSFPLASAIKPASAIFGAVNVLFVKVCVDEVVTSPAGNVRMLGFVPSLAVAKTIYHLCLLRTKLKSPDPVTYLNCTVCDPLVEFLKYKKFVHLKE